MKRLSVICLSMAGLTTFAESQDRRTFSISEEPPTKSVPSEIAAVDSAAPNKSAPATSPKTQWLMFTADWCVPCQSARRDFETWLQRSGWRIDESPAAHLRLIQADLHADLVQHYGVRMFPTFVLQQGDHELRRHEGYPGRMELVNQYLEAVRVEAPAVGTISVGTLHGQQTNIAQVIAAFRPLLGTEGKLTVRLDRPGTSTAVLPFGDQFSIRADNPLVMQYSLRGDVLTCRFAKPFPRGRFSFGVPIEQTVSAVSVSLSEVVLELPRAPDVRFKVEP